MRGLGIRALGLGVRGDRGEGFGSGIRVLRFWIRGEGFRGWGLGFRFRG